MTDHWETAGPPIYVSAAAYLGLGRDPTKKGQVTTTAKSAIGEDPAKLFEQFRHTGGMIQ